MVRLTDETGTIVQSIAYDPFGSTVYAAGIDGTAYQFTDQELDAATGFYYYGARYYDPELGRFISPDTVLDGLNRYTYCGNSPIMYIDPTGHWSIGLGIVFGWTQAHGWHMGVGAAFDFTDEVGFGVNASCVWNQDGSSTTAIFAGAAFNWGFAGINMGVGYSYNTYTGHNVFGAIGGSFFGIGLEVGTSHYWSNGGTYGGYISLKAQFGLNHLNIGRGYKWGFGGILSGYYSEAEVLGVAFSEYGGKWSFDGYSDRVGMGYNSGQNVFYPIVLPGAKDFYTAAGLIGGTALAIVDALNGDTLSPEVTFDYGTINFVTNFDFGGALTLGDVVIYAGNDRGRPLNPNSKGRYYGKTIIVGEHEEIHARVQYPLIGLGFLPIWAISGMDISTNWLEIWANNY